MSTTCRCAHCGSKLSLAGEQPCPFCGKTGRSINVSISESISIQDNHIVGIKDGKTGRSAVHSDSKNPADTALIQKYIKAFITRQTNALEMYVNNLVAPFSSELTDEYGTFYRGLGTVHRGKIIGNQIGPSPLAEDGRYNTKYEKCLYLINDTSFLPFEIGTTEILIQKYKIPLSGLHIADLSVENKAINNSLSLLLQMTERGKTSSGIDFENQLEQNGKSKYLVSQSVARAFKQYGWQGMYIPGVHGKPGNIYGNLVLFGDCVDEWKTWANGDYYEYHYHKI